MRPIPDFVSNFDALIEEPVIKPAPGVNTRTAGTWTPTDQTPTFEATPASLLKGPADHITGKWLHEALVDSGLEDFQTTRQAQAEGSKTLPFDVQVSTPAGNLTYRIEAAYSEQEGPSIVSITKGETKFASLSDVVKDAAGNIPPGPPLVVVAPDSAKPIAACAKPTAAQRSAVVRAGFEIHPQGDREVVHWGEFEDLERLASVLGDGAAPELSSLVKERRAALNVLQEEQVQGALREAASVVAEYVEAAQPKLLSTQIAKHLKAGKKPVEAVALAYKDLNVTTRKEAKEDEAAYAEYAKAFPTVVARFAEPTKDQKACIARKMRYLSKHEKGKYKPSQLYPIACSYCGVKETKAAQVAAKDQKGAAKEPSITVTATETMLDNTKKAEEKSLDMCPGCHVALTNKKCPKCGVTYTWPQTNQNMNRLEQAHFPGVTESNPKPKDLPGPEKVTPKPSFCEKCHAWYTGSCPNCGQSSVPTQNQNMNRLEQLNQPSQMSTQTFDFNAPNGTYKVRVQQTDTTKDNWLVTESNHPSLPQGQIRNPGELYSIVNTFDTPGAEQFASYVRPAGNASQEGAPEQNQAPATQDLPGTENVQPPAPTNPAPTQAQALLTDPAKRIKDLWDQGMITTRQAQVAVQFSNDLPVCPHGASWYCEAAIRAARANKAMTVQDALSDLLEVHGQLYTFSDTFEAEVEEVARKNYGINV